MFLSFTRCFLIIILNSGLHSFSMDTPNPREPELQRVYNKYDQASKIHIEVPKYLCELYEFHKTNIIDNYKGYYAKKEDNNEQIFDFCSVDLLFVGGDPEEVEEFNKELLLTIQYANNPSHPNSDFKITRHSYPGNSGAEIFHLHGDNMKNPKIAKIFRCKSMEDIKPAFSELSNLLISLATNQDPSNIRMVRVYSAGYTYFRDSKNYIFCMLLESASGKSIKELLHDKFIEFIDNPKLLNELLKNSAQYLAHFHANFSYGKFRENNQINLEVRNKEIEERERFCGDRIRMLSQNIVFDSQGYFLGFNPKSVLKNMEGKFDQGMVQSSEIQDSNEGHILLGQHLVDNLYKVIERRIPLEDRIIIHGDMHIGNLCYKDDHIILPLNRFIMIDFSSIKRTYAAIGDPAQDVGKFLGSIWEEITIICADRQYDNKDNLETWYSILCNEQEAFLASYIHAFKETKLYKKHFATSDSEFMATFRQRVYYYKLYLFTQVFASSRIKGKAKELLYYFLLRESGLLDQVIAANSSNANTGLKINSKQAPLQLESNADASDYIPIIGLLERVTSDSSDGQTPKQPVNAYNFIARLYNSNTIQ